MYPIIDRNTSPSFSSSTSSSAKVQRNLVSNDEVTIEDFNKCIYNFKLTEIDNDYVYKTSRLNLFKSNYVIRTKERDVQLDKAKYKIKLLSSSSINKHKAKGFRYIHIGLVQVGIKSLNREGLNTYILAALRHKRFWKFEDFLLGTIESNLCKDPISFDCYPNFIVSLNDTNLLQSLVL